MYVYVYAYLYVYIYTYEQMHRWYALKELSLLEGPWSVCRQGMDDLCDDEVEEDDSEEGD